MMRGQSISLCHAPCWLRWCGGDHAGDIDADGAIVAADVLSRQALDAQAEDLALEDAMYELDKSLQESTQPAEAYLKQVRSGAEGSWPQDEGIWILAVLGIST